MKQGVSGVLSLAMLVLGVALVAPPAFAKCTKECKKAIATEAKTCKSACPKGKTGRECKKTCRDEKKSDTLACKHATNPTPPGCGEASPSGAFTG